MSKFEINSYGSKRYFNDEGALHREDGPAIEWANGDKEWWLNNILHREDGPAIEYFEGRKSWYYNNKKIYCNSQEEFLRMIKMKAFW